MTTHTHDWSWETCRCGAAQRKESPAPEEIAAQAMHRWKHPTVDIDLDRCSCRPDAAFALSLVQEKETAA